jgi:hypothetical protein
MAFDYAGLAATARQLIADAGRPMDFTIKSRSPADSSKPWRGPATADAEVIEDVFAAIVPVDFADEDRGVLKTKASAMLYVSALEFEDGFDPKQLDTVDDGTWTWRVVLVEPVMPGVTPVIYQLMLEG